MALIGYARVSTTDQDPSLQLNALSDAGCLRIFSETASGAKQDRPQLKAALDYMREGDTLVVWKLDRLARSLKQLVETSEALEERGLHFRSLTESIDTASPSGRLIFNIMGSLAEFERALIKERTLAGLEAARKRGRVGGRPKALDEAGLIQARALMTEGRLSAGAVAQRLGVSRATLYRRLGEG